VTENPRVLAGLTRDGIRWAFTSREVANWHPLTWLSHMADVEWFGTDAGAHHLVNLAFHGANAILLFLVLCRMTRMPWRSGIVAALFAVHPLHVESVAWVAERKDVLSTFFWLLTMGAYARYAERPGLLRYLPVPLLLALGLMSKAMLVTLPFVLLLLDGWPLRRFAPAGGGPPGGTGCPPAGIRRLLAEKAPLLLLSAACSAIAYSAQQASGTVTSLERFPPGTRIANALISYVSYAGKAFWPEPLSVFYPHPGAGIPGWHVAAAAAALAGASALAAWQCRRRPYLAVGWFWYLGTLVPVIGLVQVGFQAMADRYTYVPLIGLSIAGVWGAADIGEALRIPRRALGAAAAAALLAFSVAAHRQAGYWRDSVTLFRHAVEVTRGNWLAHENLGLALGLRGRTVEALGHFRESIRLNPAYDKSFYNCGIALMILGRDAEAVACLREAVRIRPEFANARVNLGSALLRSGAREEGILQLRQVLREDPANAAANLNLGLALLEGRNYRESAELFRRYLRVRPGDPRGHMFLGDALSGEGNAGEAFASYGEALRLSPEDPEIRQRLFRGAPGGGRFVQ
jgi:Flp pilus assembly protein TadD